MSPFSTRRGAAAILLCTGCVSAGTNPASVPPAAQRSASLPPQLVVDAPTGPREQTADQQVQQVLNRLAFGVRPGDVARVRALGVDQWIALQLAPGRIVDTTAERIVASYETLALPTGEVMSIYQEGQVALRRLQRGAAQGGDSSSRQAVRADALRTDPELRGRLQRVQRVLGDAQSARVARAVVSERQLQEVMTDFWANHFTVYAGKGITRFLIPAYEREVIRPHALGEFRTLLGAVARSPAMLFYLDQWQSAADSTRETLAMVRRRGAMSPAPRRRPAMQPRPGAMTRMPGRARDSVPAAPVRRPRGLNENYARELMELHTLGVDAGYSQQDVIEVARALTGWTIVSRQRPEFVFRPQIHDAGEKTVLGRRLAAGRGIEDGEEVLDILARDPRTARFIARKLAVRFVSDEPPAELVDRAAATFLRTNGDIREVLRTIVTGPEFFSAAAYRSKVKSPFELVASALRAVGAEGDTTMRSAQMVAYLGQPIYGHQAPNGWPETGDAWMNAGAILNRINFGLVLAAGRLPGARLDRWPDAQRLHGAGRETQVDAVIAAFLGGRASPDTRDILMKGENPLTAHLAGADTARMRDDDPADRLERDVMMDAMPSTPPMRPRAGRRGTGLGQPVPLSGLAQVVGLAIGAPEFQRK